MYSAFGNMKRLPLAPLDAITVPIEAAIPMTMVWTSDLIKFMVSTIAKPAETEPPGVLIYI